MSFRCYSELDKNRDFLLDLAIRDTKKWCVLPDVPALNKKPSDQYWLEQFSRRSSREVSEEQMRKFIGTFQLARAGWNYDELLPVAYELLNLTAFNPEKSVPRLAKDFGKCTARGYAQTSAVSKLSNFAFPSQQVYIWDRLATKSARLRDKARTGSKSRSLNLYRNAAGHDYAAYHAACHQAHKEEMARPDFIGAVSELNDHFLAQGGPMSDRSWIPIDFIERRLLDKFMFWEGWTVDRKKLPDTSQV